MGEQGGGEQGGGEQGGGERIDNLVLQTLYVQDEADLNDLSQLICRSPAHVCVVICRDINSEPAKMFQGAVPEGTDTFKSELWNNADGPGGRDKKVLTQCSLTTFLFTSTIRVGDVVVQCEEEPVVTVK